jgi:hypothetical protein
MNRAQGHIANVLCVLFDQVIDRQRQQKPSTDAEMMDGKLKYKYILFLHSLQTNPTEFRF